MFSGIVDILTVVAADKAEKVQRRAAAALGELMFYISDKDPSAGGWSIKVAVFVVLPTPDVHNLGPSMQCGSEAAHL